MYTSDSDESLHTEDIIDQLQLSEDDYCNKEETSSIDPSVLLELVKSDDDSEEYTQQELLMLLEDN